jgi:hypothetical protein
MRPSPLASSGVASAITEKKSFNWLSHINWQYPTGWSPIAQRKVIALLVVCHEQRTCSRNTRCAPDVSRQMTASIASVVTGTIYKTRFALPHKRKAHGIKSSCRADATIVSDASLAIENRYFQPAVVRARATGPNHCFDFTT